MVDSFSFYHSQTGGLVAGAKEMHGGWYHDIQLTLWECG